MGLVAAETPPTTVLILPLEAKGGVDRDFSEQLTALLVNEAARVPGFHVVSMKELEGAIGQEIRRQAAGCDAVSCAAEIAGALNADQVVMGSLGQVGNSYVITLTRIQSRNAQVVARAAERVPASDKDLVLDRIPSIVATLMQAQTVEQPKTLTSVESPPSPAAAPSGKGKSAPAEPVGKPGGINPLLVALVGVSAVGIGVGLLVALAGLGLGGFSAVTTLIGRLAPAPAGADHAVPFGVAMASNAALVLGLPVLLVGVGLLVGAAVVGVVGIAVIP